MRSQTLFGNEVKYNEVKNSSGSHRSALLSLIRLLASHLALWLIVILLGASIAAAQLLPSLEFITRSLRTELSYQAVSAGLPLNEFISILYPGFFGGSPEYVGIASLVLIGLATLKIR